MPDERVNEATRKEWRELGFFYDRDDKKKEWHILGSRSGLLEFARILWAYSNHPVNKRLSEHDHLGPYSYLEIGTWSEPVITDHWIAGTLADIARLSTLIESGVPRMGVGDRIGLRKDYAANAPYELVIEMREDDFDPARADRGCW